MKSLPTPFEPGVQRKRYGTSSMWAHCEMLAVNPGLGRPCPCIRPGLRRSETGGHVILFRDEPAEIVISRILHQRMLPGRHPIDETDEET
jgi:toxin ParE1/3/4